ncbi:TraR/DksA family transcriptional regulator [Patescibacteria group bacterium]|nr:TraR/DksA family transcriptional regulator [Patescibacteria group bacterium]
MLNFPGKTLEFVKKHLLHQQREVNKNLRGIEEDDPAKSPALAESSEPGTDSYIAESHAKRVILQDQLMKMKNTIRLTLSKIKIGTYGKCDGCGKWIEGERLQALPTAQYCLSCSRKTPRVR